VGWRRTPPEGRQKAIIIPVFEKGNIKDCENYRGNLLNSGYKIHVL
jgi:hypothetical protein